MVPWLFFAARCLWRPLLFAFTSSPPPQYFCMYGRSAVVFSALSRDERAVSLGESEPLSSPYFAPFFRSPLALSISPCASHALSFYRALFVLECAPWYFLPGAELLARGSALLWLLCCVFLTYFLPCPSVASTFTANSRCSCLVVTTTRSRCV